jgi:DNA polymerase III psi subunit
MDVTALYESDIHAWSQHQARVLRGLASAGVRLPNDLDLEHVAEEIEEVGNEQRFQAESNLIQALVHLLKIAALPEDQAVRHWRKETRAFLRNAARRYRPSMRQLIDMAALWASARRDAAQDLADEGHALPPLPQACPLALEQLLDAEADPLALAGRLMAPPGGEPR